MVLLTTHAKQSASTDVVERFFSDPGPSAYEITRGKLLKPGRYEFEGEYHSKTARGAVIVK